jgi:hypothetical protein
VFEGSRALSLRPSPSGAGLSATHPAALPSAAAAAAAWRGQGPPTSAPDSSTLHCLHAHTAPPSDGMLTRRPCFAGCQPQSASVEWFGVAWRGLCVRAGALVCTPALTCTHVCHCQASPRSSRGVCARAKPAIACTSPASSVMLHQALPPAVPRLCRVCVQAVSRLWQALHLHLGCH